ncbi:hypothetical protein [Kribbella lupini]|uniref:Uncharacterized protein n=1 Tax=Kribbella lupini TaxID=291602 RepID=A0ABN2CBM2_9ACTN
MNLTDLRDELSDRADTVETPDLLPGVRRRIRTTKRRRVAGSLTAVAAVVALGIAVAPSLTTSAPEPADAPQDYTRDAVVLKGMIGTDRLDKAWIGGVGESRGSFSWTPTTNDVVVYTYCAAPGAARYAVRFGGREAVTGPCNSAYSSPENGVQVRPDAPVWLDVPLNQVTTVNVQLTDEDGKAVESGSAQLGVGVYRAGRRDPLPGATDATPTPAPGDREENGLKFRAHIGGDTLLTAAGGKPGVNSLSGSYESTGRAIQIASFCTANDGLPNYPYDLWVSVGGVVRVAGCVALTTDVGIAGGGMIPALGKPGETVNVTARLTDKAGREVTVPGARIGFAVYEKGPQRVYDDMALDERMEYAGTTYQLTDIRAADASTTRQVSLRTPADTSFLVVYGSSALGATVDGTLDDGLAGQGMLSTDYGDTGIKSWGLQTDGNHPGPSRPVTLKITKGTPTKGKIILAVYTPVK